MNLLEIDKLAAMLSMMTDDDMSLFISRCDELDCEIINRLWDAMARGQDATVTFTPDFKVDLQ